MKNTDFVFFFIQEMLTFEHLQSEMFYVFAISTYQ